METENENIATVGDLIEFLEKNFKGDEKLKFFFEGGAYCELDYVEKTAIGDKRWMFNYVKDKKEYDMNDAKETRDKENVEKLIKIVEDNYKSVEDDGVIIY